MSKPDGSRLFHDLNILLQQLSKIDNLLRRQALDRQDIEAGGRGIEKNLILAFRPADVVLPGNVGRATVPTPVDAVGVEDYSSGALCSRLLTELLFHRPTRPSPED